MSDAIANVLLDYARNFVKVPRGAIETLCSDPLTLTVFALCISRARWTAGAVLRGGHGVIELEPGQAVIGRDELAKLCGVKVGPIRTALLRLERLGYLAIKSANRGTIVTVLGYAGIAEGSPADSPADAPETHQQHASDSPLTISREVQKPRRKKGEVSRKTSLNASWIPRPEERDLAGALKLDPDIQATKFRDYHEAKGSVMASWDAAFRTWLRSPYASDDKANGKPNGAKAPSMPTAADYIATTDWTKGTR